MINSKKQLLEALKSGNNLAFKTISNSEKPGLIGTERTKGSIIQTNAFTLKTPKNGGFVDSWIRLEDITVKDNIIKYKEFNIQIKIIEATK